MTTIAVSELIDSDGHEVRVAQVKKGQLVRFKNGSTSPVWVKDHYDRSSLKHAFHKFDDVNHEMFAKGVRKCFIGFTF